MPLSSRQAISIPLLAELPFDPNRLSYFYSGLDQRLVHETGMPIVTAERPLQSVVIGSGAVLEEFDVLGSVLHSTGRT